MNKEYFNFLFFTIHAIDIKQNEIIRHYKIFCVNGKYGIQV